MPVAPGYRWTHKWLTADCEQCGKPMTFRRSKPKRFCSTECATAGRTRIYQADPDKKETHPCPTCGKAFTFYRSWPRVYCSRSCARKQQSTRHYSTTCETCGVVFETTPSASARFCSQRCFGQWQSANVRGPAHPRYGVAGPKHPGPRVSLTCPICGKQWEETPSHAATRRFCSRACAGVWLSLHNAGENNALWKGGHAPYYGPTWQPAKRATRVRDHACQRCGKTPKECGKALDVHHRVPFRAFGLARHAEANRLENLIAYCSACHLIVEWETNRTNPEYGLWSDNEPVPPLALSALKNHPRPVFRGEQNARSVRTDDEIREIRRAYAAKEANQVELATRYHTSQANISSIVRRESWAHVV